MLDTLSPRHQLPYLIVGQAQKEITHNEALVRLDMLIHPVAEAQINAPPAVNAATPAGQSWLIGTAPTLEWQGKENQIASWVGGSWRYIVPVEGMRIRVKASNLDYIYANNAWIVPAPITNPANGTVIDIEARAALNAILATLRQTGKIAS